MDGDTEIRTLKTTYRLHHKEMDEWQQRARQELTPVCTACANIDYMKGRMKDYNDYIKDIKEVRRSETFIKEHKGKSETAVKYILIDYKCPRNHGISMQYSQIEHEELSKKKKVGKQ